MNDKTKLIRRPRMTNTLISTAISVSLVLVLLHILTPIFHLSGVLRQVIMIILCIVVSVMVSLKPRWVLTTVCILILFIGVALVFLSQAEETIVQIAWDPSLLGAGASIVAIAIAFYMLLIQMGPIGTIEEARESTDGERHTSNSKKGYVWLEDTEKYRCEYCLHSGKYHYCKTLGGIKRHIAGKHE